VWSLFFLFFFCFVTGAMPPVVEPAMMAHSITVELIPMPPKLAVMTILNWRGRWSSDTNTYVQRQSGM
jgi:hypothetical protein